MFGQRRLKAAQIAVVGAGGIGSAVIPALAGAGVGTLTIIDSDVVELANLQRQPLFRERDVGYAKAELAAQFVAPAEPIRSKRKPVQQRIGPDNAQQLLAGHDLVIDGSDNFATRLAVSDACVRARHSVAFGGGDPVPGPGRPVPRASLATAASSATRSTPTIATIAPSSACSVR